MKLLILLGLIHPWDLLAPLLVMVLQTLLVMVVWLLLELVKLDLLVKEWDSTRDLVVDKLKKKEMFVWDVGVRIWHIWNLEVRVQLTKERVPMTKEISKERVPMTKAKDQMNKKENDNSQS